MVHRQKRRASEKGAVVRARDGGALVAENVFFESFTPLAVLCSPVLDTAHKPQKFSTTIARLFRGRPAHPRTPPSVERLGKSCSRPCADFGSRQRKTFKKGPRHSRYHSKQ